MELLCYGAVNIMVRIAMLYSDIYKARNAESNALHI